MRSVRLVGDVLLDERLSAYQAVLGADYVTRAASFYGVDLADVAVGSDGCMETCREALAVGIRVVVHGPTIEETADFRELLVESQGRLRLAHPIRFDGKYTLPRKESADGNLGDVITVRVIRTGSTERHIAVEELNVLDALLLFGGRVDRIFTKRDNVRAEEMNTALSVIRFSNRAIGYGEACTAHYPGYFYEVIEVVSTGGMLEYDSFSRVNRLVGKDGIATVDSYHVPPYQAMIEDYIAGFRGDRESSVSESESVDLLDLAIRSLKTSELPEAVGD